MIEVSKEIKFMKQNKTKTKVDIEKRMDNIIKANT